MVYYVRVDHLTDDQLRFFGWLKVHSDEEFSLYRLHYDGTSVLLANKPPRLMPVDDLNDALMMSEDEIIIQGPSRRR